MTHDDGFFGEPVAATYDDISNEPYRPQVKPAASGTAWVPTRSSAPPSRGFRR